MGGSNCRQGAPLREERDPPRIERGSEKNFTILRSAQPTTEPSSPHRGSPAAASFDTTAGKPEPPGLTALCDAIETATPG